MGHRLTYPRIPLDTQLNELLLPERSLFHSHISVRRPRRGTSTPNVASWTGGAPSSAEQASRKRHDAFLGETHRRRASGLERVVYRSRCKRHDSFLSEHLYGVDRNGTRCGNYAGSYGDDRQAGDRESQS
jgi:hypothetical protein